MHGPAMQRTLGAVEVLRRKRGVQYASLSQLRRMRGVQKRIQEAKPHSAFCILHSALIKRSFIMH